MKKLLTDDHKYQLRRVIIYGLWWLLGIFITFNLMELTKWLWHG